MQHVRHWFEYLVFRYFFCLLQTLRIETCEWIADYVGWLFAELVPFRTRVIDDNLRQAFPDWSSERRGQTARAMWEHLFLMLCEVAHASRKIHHTNWRDFISFSGDSRRLLVQNLLDPRPTTIVSGHFGNFEVASYATGLLGFPTLALVRPLDNPYINRFITRFRAAHGQFILPRKGSATKVANALEAGVNLALLCDQWAGRKGSWVKFFGRITSCHKAIAVFPLANQSPLVVTYFKRDNRAMKFECVFFAIADPLQGGEHLESSRSLTQWYNHQLEDIIRVGPEQYWWLHRRWKNKRWTSPRRKAA